MTRSSRRVPTMTIDGSATTGAALAARLAASWVPSANALSMGQAPGPAQGRVAAYFIAWDDRP